MRIWSLGFGTHMTAQESNEDIRSSYTSTHLRAVALAKPEASSGNYSLQWVDTAVWGGEEVGAKEEDS